MLLTRKTIPCGADLSGQKKMVANGYSKKTA